MPPSRLRVVCWPSLVFSGLQSNTLISAFIFIDVLPVCVCVCVQTSPFYDTHHVGLGPSLIQ